MEGEKIEKGDIATARDGETQSSQKMKRWVRRVRMAVKSSLSLLW
jgi:hypothetical protein